MPIFTGEDQTSAIEHMRDVSSLYGLYHITHDDVYVRLLATSLKGKALQWFRGLVVNFIATGVALIAQFEDKSDHLYLVEHLITIKRAPHEHMMDFNFRFQRTWNKILATVRPSNQHAFLYYLRALNSDIFLMIQSMGGNNLPTAFDIGIRVENSLIQVGKIAPRPPMPIFPELQPVCEAILTLASIPPTPAPSQQATSLAMDQSQELKEIKKTLQNFTNELVSLKRQQF